MMQHRRLVSANRVLIKLSERSSEGAAEKACQWKRDGQGWVTRTPSSVASDRSSICSHPLSGPGWWSVLGAERELQNCGSGSAHAGACVWCQRAKERNKGSRELPIKKYPILCHLPNLRLHNNTSEVHFSDLWSTFKLGVCATCGWGPLTRTVLTQLCLSQGAGTEEACLIDILASRTNDEIKAVNAFYKKREWRPATNRIPDLGLLYGLYDSASGLCMISDIVYLWQSLWSRLGNAITSIMRKKNNWWRPVADVRSALYCDCIYSSCWHADMFTPPNRL